MQRLQQERVQAATRFPGQANKVPSKNSNVIRMSEFNEDDQDAEDDADGEHMAQIYSKNSID